MRSRQNRQTEQIEMVETHNLYLSLTRLDSAYDSGRWKRALYHAITMSHCSSDWNEKQKIREALGLP